MCGRDTYSPSIYLKTVHYVNYKIYVKLRLKQRNKVKETILKVSLVVVALYHQWLIPHGIVGI